MRIQKLGSRLSHLISAAAFAAAIVAPLAVNELASAASYTLLSPRTVSMSSATVSANNVQYNVSVKTSAAGYTVGSLAIETCTDPFVGTTCTASAGFNWNKATIGNPTNQVGVTNWTTDTTNSTASKLVLTHTAAALAANTTVSFTMGNGSTTGATNPSANGTFYMRIYTLTNTTGDVTGALDDAGGVALSMSTAVTVTAKVQESLTFCAYAAASSNTCATVTSNSVNLGDANGILSSTSTDYTAPIYFNVSTNSGQGATTTVTVNLFGDTLKSGSNSIAAVGNTCTAQSTATGTAQFGISLTGLGTGMSADNSYGCAANNFKFDTTNTTALGGQQIAHMTNANAESQNTVTLLGKAASTTLAGIYTTSLSFIAAATY